MNHVWIIVACLLEGVYGGFLLGQEPKIEYVVVVTGRELLEGLYADRHTSFLARTLHPLGGRCVGSVTVSDDEVDILRALSYAAQRSQIIIVTGGLGPTDDDMTRRMVSKHTGISLEESAAVIKSLQSRYRGKVLNQNVKRQARVPSRGTYLHNHIGTAVGLVFDDGNRVVVALPGPPRELEPMVRNELVPFLVHRFGIQSTVDAVTIRFVGIGESKIQRILDDHINLPEDVKIASTFDAARVDLTFYGTSSSDRVHKKLLELRDKVLVHLGKHVYSVNGSTLEERIFELLANRKSGLMVAEVSTGGGLSARLSEVESTTPFGSFVAGSTQELRELLGFEGPELSGTVREGDKITLDLGRKVLGEKPDRWVLLVSGIERGKTNSVSLCVGSQKEGFQVELARWGPGRSGRERLITQALDFLRRRLDQ